MTYNTRRFNKIYEIEYGFLKKESYNIEKIKAEYEYYYLLPDNIKEYFVKPFDLYEDKKVASYKMKKYDYETAAEQFINNKFNKDSFIFFLNKIKKYQEECPSFIITKEKGIEISKKMVLDKTKIRIQQVNMLLDDLYKRLELAFDFYKDNRSLWKMKISHGDLCLSNILWNGDIKLLDPRGYYPAIGMYIDEYYDMAKLSHSILGKYDYINNKININKNLELENIFIDYLRESGIDFNLLRVYEASLFLSMLPLHLEDKDKVSLFAQNCDLILREVGF